MHPSVGPLAQILRLDTSLLLNCLDGVSEAHAALRPQGRGNHIGFLAAHLIDSRYYMLGLLGSASANPLAGPLRGARTLDQLGELPPIAQLVSCWEAVSAELAVAIERLDTPALAHPAKPLPGSDGTTLGNLAFLVHHECYHLGQVAYLRRHGGLAAMSYAVKPREPGRLGA